MQKATKFFWLAMVIATLVFTACNGDDTTHTHDFSGEWKHNDTQHWKECPDDDAEDQRANHDFEGDICKVCDYKKPTPPPPVANAGANFEHNITTSGTTVTLNGSGANGTYSWTCTDKPTGAATPAFSNNAIAKPTVNGFNMLGEYEFKLTVSNGTDSVNDVVKVSLCRTATAEITIAERAFSTPTSELDFSVDYGTIDSFFDDRITYKINDGTEDIADTSENHSFDGKVTTKDRYDTERITFTQTFYYDGIAIPEKSCNMTVAVVGSSFVVFIENELPAPNITTPELSISLSEKVTEGSIP